MEDERREDVVWLLRVLASEIGLPKLLKYSRIWRRFASEHRPVRSNFADEIMKRLACLALFLMSLTGCQGLLHELQPHRLWRMNYSDPPGRTDGVYMSIPDDLSQPVNVPADCVADEVE